MNSINGRHVTGRSVGQDHRARRDTPASPASGVSSRAHGVQALLLSTALVAASVGAALLFASSAAAQQSVHQVSWAHSAPATVGRFVILVSPVEGDVSRARQIDVGLPPAQPAGSLTLFSAVVSFSRDEYLAVAAVGHDGQMSVPSSWSAMPPSTPGQPFLVD